MGVRLYDPTTGRFPSIDPVPPTQVEHLSKDKLTRPLAADLRRPWEKPTTSNRLTPARVRRGFRNIRAHLSTALPVRPRHGWFHDQAISPWREMKRPLPAPGSSVARATIASVPSVTVWGPL